jgi:hypothetical protein
VCVPEGIRPIQDAVHHWPATGEALEVNISKRTNLEGQMRKWLTTAMPMVYTVITIIKRKTTMD